MTEAPQPPVSPSPEWNPPKAIAFLVHRRIPFGFLFGAIFLVTMRPGWMSLAVGFPFVALGVLVRTLSSGFIRKNKELATRGCYRFCRNPLYLGSFLLVFGFSIMGGRIWQLFIVPPFFLLVYYQIIFKEEVKIRELFGEEYVAFAQRVPRLFPRSFPLDRLRKDLREEFQWNRVLQRHTEYNAWLGTAGATLLMILMVYFDFHLF